MVNPPILTRGTLRRRIAQAREAQRKQELRAREARYLAFSASWSQVVAGWNGVRMSMEATRHASNALRAVGVSPKVVRLSDVENLLTFAPMPEHAFERLEKLRR